uniref:RmlD-like substrate binding domain-containing protein n=1 Tax=Grammatophora oceanica TaxID=210454 RepID=A0A7S1Y975_9STRA|mmetsp:Transcript_38080/g.56678  ORF Transcript_38080/g.56678 Transcript_38080/m.56678 type:complete len:317 (+) Transcript_38080:42-992(+)|eukprot:CAMPEP_0194032772 /NCGR_PEP_ID=MMETSP0009_2-20130614/5642_1 /TAXON_ID=210454 /ORGANISM="Grammatophora oceanica, Strain CCMP 410" /LENGTH=316 /DNA_ID=CAMNT_0038673309 /DNA_START=42 /DNA_END=992 /DNA_ORIENTATION=+
MSREKKTILVTGVSGFLGRHLLSEISSNSSSCDHFVVHGWYGSNSDDLPTAGDRFHYQQVDLADEASVAAGLNQALTISEQVDVCLHLAAISSPRVCEADAEKAKAVNVPLHLLRALADRKIPIIALSTDQVYGGDKGSLYEEGCETQPLNVYAQGKVDLEANLRQLVDSWVALRSSIILGPEIKGAHSTFLHFCKSRLREETTFYTDEKRSVVWVGDVCATLLWFCDNGVSVNNGEYNMGGATNVSRYDMAMAVHQVCGNDETKQNVVATVKATLPPGPIVSPLDIGMDSSKLESLIGRKFLGLEDIIKHMNLED